MKRALSLLTILSFLLSAYSAYGAELSLDNYLSARSGYPTAESTFGSSLKLETPLNTGTSTAGTQSVNYTLTVSAIQDTTFYASPLSVETICIRQPHTQMSKGNFFRTPYAGFIIPAAFITYGIVKQGNPMLRQFDHDIKNAAGTIFQGRLHFDDWIQYAPLVGYFGLDLAGVKARHNFLDRTIVAATSYLILFAAVQTVKSTVHVQRPDGSAWNSFPSGHTATAFAGAQLLYREYRDVSPWIGVAGYAVATATGVMRVFNRRHWFSDVVTGAGIGIASVEIAYLLLPLFDRLTDSMKCSGKISFTPVSGYDYTGAGLAYSF